MSDTAIRRTAAAVGAGLLALLAVSGCDTGVHGQNTDNGTQLAPTELETPPAVPSETSPG
jgi:hypothetical protein